MLCDCKKSFARDPIEWIVPRRIQRKGDFGNILMLARLSKGMTCTGLDQELRLRPQIGLNVSIRNLENGDVNRISSKEELSDALKNLIGILGIRKEKEFIKKGMGCWAIKETYIRMESIKSASVNRRTKED